MKTFFHRLASSFRLRLTVFLALVMGLLLGAYGYAVSRKLEALAVDRIQSRLLQVASRVITEEMDPMKGVPPMGPPPGFGDSRKIPELEGSFKRPPRPVDQGDGLQRGMSFGWMLAGDDWHPIFGDWPEAVVAAWSEWKQSHEQALAVLELPSLELARRPSSDDLMPRPRLGRQPGPGERLPPSELLKLVAVELEIEEEPWMLLTGRLSDRYAIFAYNLNDERATVGNLGRVQSIYLPVMIVIVLVVGWVFSTRALSPVTRLASVMARMSGRNLGVQFSIKGAASEFHELIAVFNAMTERLERGFQQASRFSADAAHELKTPLTVLQGELEAAMQSETPGSDSQRVFSSMLDEVSRLKGITERLLLLARADAGSLLRKCSLVDLKSLTDDLIEDLEATTPELKVETALDVIEVEGDPFLLRQALLNLLSNASKYNLPEGWIAVRISGYKEGSFDWVAIEVENSGDPIPSDLQGNLFDRFFRVDTARSRQVDGFGLGLSLSLEIARAHGGDLELVRSDERSTLFRMTLPKVQTKA